eukprot:3370759-Alexandrium_andersonii.AAC.1
MAELSLFRLPTGLLHCAAVSGVVDLAVWEELNVGLLWLVGAGGLALVCLLAEYDMQEAEHQE